MHRGQTVKIKDLPQQPFGGWIGKFQERDGTTVLVAFAPADATPGEAQTTPAFIWFDRDDLEEIGAVKAGLPSEEQL